MELLNAPMDNLYLALIQCFAVILCGYTAGRLKIITKSEANGLNTFVGTFALPSLIFLSLAKLDFSSINWKFLLSVFLAKGCVFLVVMVLTLIISRPMNPGRAALFAIFTTQSNDFAIGYPMINALYSNTHPEYSAYLYLMAPISLAILNPIGFVLLEIGKRTNRNVNEQSRWQLIGSVIKGVLFNPILFMTVLGIIGNFVFNHTIPMILSIVLDVFGNAFSASALFLLGLMMVGKVHTLKGTALIIPGILILVKLLALPLMIRESVILIGAGSNETETNDLSTYGFIYGTIPTAPALFIFTLRYNIDIDLIASAMVACTFLSAPLMFISAKLISAINNGISPENYDKQLEAFSMDISVISLAVSLWVLICFLFFEGKKYKRPTHRCTLFMMLSQLLVAIGVIIWTKIDVNEVSTFLWYIQFILMTIGIYSSRLLSVTLSLTILFITSRSNDFIENLQKWIIIVSYLIPIFIVTIICLFVSPMHLTKNDLKNPSFQFGQTQAAISIFILLFCFVVTLGSLVLQQRYQRQHNTEINSSLIYNQESNITETTTSTTTTTTAAIDNRNIVDVEDLLSPQMVNNNHIPSGNCILDPACGLQHTLCSSNTIIDDEDIDDENTNYELNRRIENDDPQILRHVIYLIFLLCSMLVGLSLSVGTIIMEQITGVYAELVFIDVAFNFGQSLIAFGIFGLDPGLGRLGFWLKKICREWKMRQKLQLPDEDTLSPEIKSIRDQFKQCHLSDCRNRIAMCRRRLLTVYEGVFYGSDLVNWLLEAGIAQSRKDAVRYGRCLLESRVLHHIDGTQHFYDKNILYTFHC